MHQAGGVGAVGDADGQGVQIGATMFEQFLLLGQTDIFDGNLPDAIGEFPVDRWARESRVKRNTAVVRGERLQVSADLIANVARGGRAVRAGAWIPPGNKEIDGCLSFDFCRRQREESLTFLI